MQVTDLEFLTEFCQQDQVKMEKYIRLYIQKADGFLEDLHAPHPADRLADILHGFKANMTMMGMREAKDLAVEMEDMLRTGNDRDAIRTQIETLRDQVEHSKTELEDFLTGIS